MDLLHALENYKLQYAFTMGIVRGDSQLLRQAIARMWRDKEQQGYLKWRLPFLVCSYSYNNIREFGAEIFRSEDVTGTLILDVLEKITKAPKTREAWALVEIYFNIMSSKFHSVSPDINRFFDFMRAPRIKSTQDYFLSWYYNSINNPISSKDAILLHATVYLLSIRDLQPNLDCSGYADQSYLRYMYCKSDDDINKILSIIGQEVVESKSLDTATFRKLFEYLYIGYPDDYCGSSLIMDSLVDFILGAGSKKMRTLWEEVKGIFDDRFKGGYADASRELDGENDGRGEFDILQASPGEDAQEELREGDGIIQNW